MTLHKYLRSVSNPFYIQGGGRVCNLNQLAKSFENMGAKQYEHHAGGNDFSNWVLDVVGDRILASKLSDAESREDAENIVTQRVLQLKHLPDTTKEADGLKEAHFTNQPISVTQELPEELNEVVQDIEMLNQNMSTESFMQAYKEMRYSNQPEQDEIRESEQGILVMRKSKNPKRVIEKDFMSKITTLQNMVAMKEIQSAKQLYNALKEEFESRHQELPNRQSAYRILMNCYNEIKKY